MYNKLTHEQFIERATNKHGNKYDYSLTSYRGMHEKIDVVCPLHGKITIRAHDHLKGYGCAKCGTEVGSRKISWTTDLFVKEAKNIHGEKYNYDKSVYKNMFTKVIIICPLHGEFTTTPSVHINNHAGCRKCSSEVNGRKKRMSKAEFLERANSLHDSKYDYSAIIYDHGSDKITVICPEHGPWEVLASAHVKRNPTGCPTCGSIKRAKGRCTTQNEFVSKAKSIHGDKYDYTRTVYEKGKQKVTVTCPEHGDVSILPRDHLRGSACATCAKAGYQVSSPGFVYILKYDNITKVGITNRGSKYRIREIHKSAKFKFKLLMEILFQDGQEALDIETSMLNKLRQNYEKVSMNFQGASECYFNVPDEVVCEMLMKASLNSASPAMRPIAA